MGSPERTGGCGAVANSRRRLGRRYAGRPMSTRKLILAALLCGVAILVAFTVQVLLI
jgi:hypothetical protein